MAWSPNRRKEPAYWPKLRVEILTKADYMCEHRQTETSLEGSRTVRCTYPANEVDHILNLARGGTDSADNLQALCKWHHRQKTNMEAAEGRKKNPRPSEYRAREKHPGLTD